MTIRAHSIDIENLTLAQRLSDFVCQTEYEDLPAHVREEARRVFANAVCTMIAGSGDDSVSKLFSALQPMMGPREATVFGLSEKADVPTAAFLNAASGNLLDYDDTHLATLIHLGSVIYAALLALSQHRPATGKKILHAYCLGSEVESRLGLALGPGHYPHGWHITATCGTIGAAVACCKLLDFNETQTAHAIGIAANMSGGLIENLSSMAKSVGVGDAARNGLMAALYAEAGVGSADTVIEGPQGFLSVFSDSPDFGIVGGGLGDIWHFVESSCKPYACCVLLFPVIDAILEIREKHPLQIDRIRSISVRGNPLMVHLYRHSVTSPREAKLCLQHGVAVAVVRGTAGIADFFLEAIADEDVKKVAMKVTAEEDESYSSVSALVTISMDDGETYTVKTEYCRGSAQRPLSDAEVLEKCRTILSLCAPYALQTRLVDDLWHIESAPSIESIVKLATPPTICGLG